MSVPLEEQQLEGASPDRSSSSVHAPNPAWWKRSGAVARRVVVDLRVVGERFLENQGILLAAGLSFAFVLCIAPVLLILFSLAGFLLESDEIAEYLFDSSIVLLPAYSREVADFLGVLANERAVTGLVGMIGLAMFATQLFSLTRAALNRVFGVPVGRGFVRGFAFDVLAIGILGALVIGFAVAVIVLATLGELAGKLLSPVLAPSTPMRRLVSQSAIHLVGGCLLFIVYRTFPNTRVPFHAAAGAAAAVAICWELAGRLFSAYIHLFGVYGHLYGSFGVGMAVLVWIYYSAIIFVLGGQFAGILTERATPRSPARSPSGGPEAAVEASPRPPAPGRPG